MVAKLANRCAPGRCATPFPWAVIALLLSLPFSAPARAQDEGLKDGIFISVNSPVTTDVLNRVKTKTERALNRTDRPARTLVYDFNPGPGSGSASETRDYGTCADLADYLLKLSTAHRNVVTVAFVHNEVSGHTVLPVLACSEIVMSRDAKLGPVFRDPGEEPRKDQLAFYADVAKARGRFPAVVLKMLDKDLEVLEKKAGGATLFIARDAKNKSGEIALPRGACKAFGALEARERFGLCNLVADSRQDVAHYYQLTPSSLREDPLEGRDPNAERIVLRQSIDPAMGSWLPRLIRQAIGRRANVIILQIESPGGDMETAGHLAKLMAELRDDRGELPVMSIAYIPKAAPGAGTVLALGCTEIIMGKGAEIGDFDAVFQANAGKGNLEQQTERLSQYRQELAGLAREQGYPEIIAQGMLDPTLTIYRVRSKNGQSMWRFISAAELQNDKDGIWDAQTKALIKPGDGTLLKLDAAKAKEYGIAREVVGNTQELYDLYSIKQVRDAELDFLYRMAEFLRQPVVAVFLIMIGIACMILELKMPGVSLPGILAALCFLLYFWSQSHQMAGQIVWLAILLFVLGLVLIGLEIFLLPGSAVAGVSGLILLILSLGLATLDKKPETTQEWMSFGRTLGNVGFGLAGAVVLAFALARYLPSIPYANRLVLKPPRELGEDGDLDQPAAVAPAAGRDFSALLGAIGVAATTLRPAGIARFGDEFVDVVTDGSYVQAGSRVQIIEIEGIRVVVKEV
jgi:membrane-bound ClpP family serine protease